MVSRQLVSLKSRVAAVTGIATLVVQLISPAFVAAEDHSRQTRTPIKHVIVIIGENRTFDHVFATYKPKRGETRRQPALQRHCERRRHAWAELCSGRPVLRHRQQRRRLSVSAPPATRRYSVLPPALAGGYTTAPFPDVATAKAFENGLPDDYYVYMTTGGTGLAHGALDTRIPNADKLPNGPFQFTSATHPYDAYDNSPVHRFYQMWQQFDCKASRATRNNPSGCKNDLWPWVEITIGAGLQRQAAACRLQRHQHRRRLDRHGLLQRAAGRCALPEVPRRQLRDERQLPSIRDGRHRRESRHAGHAATRSGSAMAADTRFVLRTTSWSLQAARMAALWTKSKIRIPSPAPTTGTRKMATVPAPSVRLLPAVEPTASAPTPPRPA